MIERLSFSIAFIISIVVHTKTAWSDPLPPVPRYKGSRIAQFARNEQRTRTPRRYIIHQSTHLQRLHHGEQQVLAKSQCGGSYTIIPLGRRRCLAFDKLYGNLRDSYSVKNKAYSHAFTYVLSTYATESAVIGISRGIGTLQI